MIDFFSFIKVNRAMQRAQHPVGREAVMQGVYGRKTPKRRRSGTKFQGKAHTNARAIERRQRQIAKGMLKPNAGQTEKGAR